MRIENRLDLDSRQTNLVVLVVSELIVLVDSWCAACPARETEPRATCATPIETVSHTHTARK